MMECRGIIHVVREGDTLYLLGKKYHGPLLEIMYSNPFVDIYNLQTGGRPWNRERRKNRSLFFYKSDK